VTLNPSTITATALNEVFTVDITVSNVQNLWGWSFNYTWDSRILTLVSVTEGDFLSDRVDATAFLPVPPTDFGFDQRDPNAQNLIGMKFQRVSCSGASSSDGMQQSASGSGVLSTITFKVIKQIQSTPITLYVEQLLGPIEDDRTAGSPHPIITPSSPTSTALVSLIIPGPPTANAGREQTVNAGTPVTFNASQSISTGNGTSYEWTFTDGAMQNLTGQVINYTFDTPGNYTVTLTFSAVRLLQLLR
jgi:PKD repeat protein